MSDQMLIRHCSPTLAGLKTANLFACDFQSAEELRESIRRLNRLLAGKGIRVMPLRVRNGRALIYVYRPTMLRRDLRSGEACRLLAERGYRDGSPEQRLSHLMQRLREGEEFPHEIGLFLGYPPEDVSGFIEQGADAYKLVGDWKVYGDADKARAKFACYSKCKKIYSSQHKLGRSIEQLTVAV